MKRREKEDEGGGTPEDHQIDTHAHCAQAGGIGRGASPVTASQHVAASVPMADAPLFCVLAALVPSPLAQLTSVLESVLPVHLPVTVVADRRRTKRKHRSRRCHRLGVKRESDVACGGGRRLFSTTSATE